MLQHLLAGIAALAFTRWLERKSVPRTRRALIAYVAIALGMLPMHAGAAEPIADGATVRIRSNSIEAGWHMGRITRDSRHCSMIQLDHPTQHGYTLLALMVVDALQLGRTGEWTAVNAKQALASEPAHCLADAAD